MKKILCILLITFYQLGFSQASPDFFKQANTFFSTYVTNGKVQYASIKANPTTLNKLMELISLTNVTSSDAKNYQSFYINAYNLAVIKGIVDNYPTKSPLNIGGFLTEKNILLLELRLL